MRPSGYSKFDHDDYYNEDYFINWLDSIQYIKNVYIYIYILYTTFTIYNTKSFLLISEELFDKNFRIYIHDPYCIILFYTSSNFHVYQ